MPSSRASSKMLKAFLMEDPPTDSSMFSSFEAVLAKAFKVVVSRLRWRNTCKIYDCEAEAQAMATVVKTKVIVRWSSFQDLAEDVPSGPYGSDFFSLVVTGFTSSSSNTSSSCDSTSGGGSKGTSWCESDFSEGRPSPTCRAFAHNPRGRQRQKASLPWRQRVSSLCDDMERPDSLVSVIGLRYVEDEDVHVEDSFREDEWPSDDAEDRPRHALSLIELSRKSPIAFKPHMERLLIDFSTSELSCESMRDGLEQEVVDTARRWIKGELYGANRWGIGGRKDVYITEMDEAGMWTGFKEGEKKGIVLGEEAEGFNELMKEVLVECLAQ